MRHLPQGKICRGLQLYGHYLESDLINKVKEIRRTIEGFGVDSALFRGETDVRWLWGGKA